MRRSWLIVTLLLLLTTTITHAQSDEVYVTTQDYVALRAGPGMSWDRLAVVPPATTLHAVGRTIQSHWIQVEYDGLHGWIASWLVVWSGKFYELPVDGVDPLPFSRRIEVTGGVIGDVYTRPSNLPEDRVDPDTLQDCTGELTARLGSALPLWVQFRCGDEYYWGTMYNPPNQGNIFTLPDAAVLYAYGRLLGQLREYTQRALPSFQAIDRRWTSLSRGQSVSCNDIPALAETFVYDETDVAHESLFAGAVEALTTAIDHTNVAITLFNDACAREGADRALPPELITQAMAEVDTAERNFTFVATFFQPLAEHDPALGSDRGLETP